MRWSSSNTLVVIVTPHNIQCGNRLTVLLMNTTLNHRNVQS